VCACAEARCCLVRLQPCSQATELNYNQVSRYCTITYVAIVNEPFDNLNFHQQLFSLQLLQNRQLQESQKILVCISRSSKTIAHSQFAGTLVCKLLLYTMLWWEGLMPITLVATLRHVACQPHTRSEKVNIQAMTK
jgi:hypothetical protein